MSYQQGSSSAGGAAGDNGGNGGNGNNGSRSVYYNYPTGTGSGYYGHPTQTAAAGETRPHVIIERTNSTPAENLRAFLVEITRDDVTSYFCGWQGCQHPVGFARQSQLVAHIRSVHLLEKPFLCTTCNASFDRRQDASRHVATLNRRQYKCSGCGRAFSRRDDRDAHEEECLAQNGAED
ncbi:hypothetical protein M422DRAFT_775264 [Sphaerobolus stellatus SS14]|nr:hypothetical protein M422DRAFT_775264 [Sphaerobolus stellatus SS14]